MYVLWWWIKNDLCRIILCFSHPQTHTHTHVHSFFCLLNLEPAEKKMDPGNHSSVTEFILAGLTEQPRLQLPLFLLFLGIYVVMVVGNLGMIILTRLSSHLHTPMYYFLSSLSFMDLCQSTVITPRILVSFVTEKSIISYLECITQLYFFLLFAISECYMLAAMAYDHYVAICSPLLYNSIMSHQACFSLIWGVYDGTGMCILSHRLHA